MMQPQAGGYRIVIGLCYPRGKGQFAKADNVPRYFFHFSDGQREFSDTTGQELIGLRAARAHATQHVRELKAAMCDPHIQDLSGWSMTVVDAAGRPVFVIGFDLKPRMLPETALTPE